MIATNYIDANTAIPDRASVRTPLQLLAGFFFAYRFCLTYLGFQSDPRAGSIAYLVCSALMVIAGLLYTLGDKQFSIRFFFESRTVRWLLTYLAVSGFSLFWTAAASITDATGQWLGMVMEVMTVLLLVKKPNIASQVDALLKGFVVGMLLVAAVAWLAPTMPDLRIGNEEFMHPNGLGLNCGLGFFLAQYLALKNPTWRWCCLALGITLLRSISKTSIIAFLFAEMFYLLKEKQISRWMKFKIFSVVIIVIASFGTLLDAYLTAYTTTANVNQVETLTGRTAIWVTAFFIAIERPWIGHGLYSFRALIPAFGTFQPWHAHNEVLQQFFELGLLGVVVVVGLYLSLVRSGRRSPARRYGDLAVVVALFAIVRGMADTMNFGLSLPLWLFSALALALLQPRSKAIAL